MDPINQRWFDFPSSIERARGDTTKGALVDPNGKIILKFTNGGISAPQPWVVPAGSFIARFGSKRLGPRTNLSAGGLFAMAAEGEWWLDRVNFERVKAFAQSKGVGLPVAVRLLCCVPLEWSDLDLLIEAQTKQELRAYRGLANPARIQRAGYSENLPAIPDHRGQMISQLYIPGLTSGDVRHDALMVNRQQFLSPELGRTGYVIRPA